MGLYYGWQVVLEILKSNLKAEKLLFSEEIEPARKALLISLAQKRHIPVQTVKQEFLRSRIQGNHQGVAVEAAPIQPIEFKSFLHSLSPTFKGFLCLCDEVQDPQNLGAIIRSAVCFDCAGIVLPKRRSSPVSEAVMRSSSGALAHCPMIEIANLGVAVERLKERGFIVVGADLSAKAFLDEVSLQFPLALILGSEHEGIRPILSRNCDQLLKIRQSQKFDSLNVSNAATIFFNEIYKQIVNGKTS